MPNFYIIGDIGNTDIKICVYKNKILSKKSDYLQIRSIQNI